MTERSNRRQRLPALAAVVALACAACGNPHPIYPVSGKVTYRGTPAAGAVVALRRQGGDPMNEHLVMGLVQADGSFELSCGPWGRGAPPGAYDVLIEWKAPAGRPGAKRPDRLKGRYGDPRHPRLHAVVRAETNAWPPFELTD